VDDARLDVGEEEREKEREARQPPPLPPLGSQPGNKRGERTGKDGEKGTRRKVVWGERPSEYVYIRGRKTRRAAVARKRERSVEKGGEREREKWRRGRKKGEEGIAEKRQEGGYSRLHSRGSGASSYRHGNRP